MSDVELIFLVLAGFYLWECAFWVRPGALVLVSQLGALPRGKRSAAIDETLTSTFNGKEIAALFRKTRRRSALLMIPCGLVFLYLFVVLPLVAALNLAVSFLEVAAGYLVLLVGTM